MGVDVSMDMDVGDHDVMGWVLTWVLIWVWVLKCVWVLM